MRDSNTETIGRHMDSGVLRTGGDPGRHLCLAERCVVTCYAKEMNHGTS